MKEKEKKIYEIIAVVLFAVILTLPTVAWGCLELFGMWNPTIMEMVDYDLGEKREKSEFPKKFNQEFPSQLEAYYNDHLPFRSAIITMKGTITGLIEKPYDKVIGPALVQIFYASYENPLEKEKLDKPKIDMKDLFGQKETAETSSGENKSTIMEESTTLEEMTTEQMICEHEWGNEEILKQASCTEKGILVFRCQKCGQERREEIAESGHQMVLAGVYEPTYEKNGYTLYRCEICGLEYMDDIKDKLTSDEYLPPKVYNSRTIAGRQKWLFYAWDDNLEYYLGTNIMGNSQMAEYVSAMNRLKELCDACGKELYYLMIPDKCQVYEEYMPSYTIEDSYKRTQRLKDYIQENSAVKAAYPLEEMNVAKQYWQIYLKYDTHWNFAGAFIGTQILYKMMGMPVTNLQDIKTVPYTNEGGDLISLGGLNASEYTDDTNYQIEYKPDIMKISSSGILDEASVYTSESTAANDKRFVMVGDSYRSAMVPFIEKDFRYCTFVHRKAVKSAGMEEIIKNADVIVVECVERNDGSLISTTNSIADMLSQ